MGVRVDFCSLDFCVEEWADGLGTADWDSWVSLF